MRRPTLKAQTRRRLLSAVALAALAADAGCHHDRARRYADDEDGPPPTQVVTAPAASTYHKPLPPQNGAALPPAYADPALVRQQVPEEPRYVQAYGNIGKPRLLVFVNRTVTGELVPVAPSVTVRGGNGTTAYLQPGQYDEAEAKAIDYELIENLLTEDLAADGKVTVIAPMSARQRLSEDDVRAVQAGRPQMLGQVAVKLNADVLVQVTARPSQQTDVGLGIRLVAEALNTHGGQAIALASVDVPPPLTKPQLNEYVRFVARKLMDGMSTSWEDMAAAPATPPPAAAAPPPTPAVSAPPVVPAPPPVQVAPPASGGMTPAVRPPATQSTGDPSDLPPPP